MGEIDDEALAALLPVLGELDCEKAWIEGFQTLTCTEAHLGGDVLESFGPADITSVVAAACQTGNGGYAEALLRLKDGMWAAMLVVTDTTLGGFRVYDSRGYVAAALEDVVFWALNHDARDHLGIPNDIDDARKWAGQVEVGNLTPISRVYEMLGGQPRPWADAFDEVAEWFDKHRSETTAVGLRPYAPRDIVGILKSHQGLGEHWLRPLCAVLRLRDGRWASLEFVNGQLTAPALGRSLADVAWRGLSPGSRTALGIPDGLAEFRAWAIGVEAEVFLTAAHDESAPDNPA